MVEAWKSFRAPPKHWAPNHGNLLRRPREWRFFSSPVQAAMCRAGHINTRGSPTQLKVGGRWFLPQKLAGG